VLALAASALAAALAIALTASAGAAALFLGLLVLGHRIVLGISPLNTHTLMPQVP